MVDFSDKVVKFFTKITDYKIFTQENGCFLIGTWINIDVSQPLSVNPMNPNTVIKKREFPVVFILTLTKLDKKLEAFFKGSGLYRLKPEKEDLKSLDSFEKLLNRFVEKKFYN